MKKLLSYLGVLIFGIVIGRFFTPKPIVTVEQIETQTEMMDTLSGFMEGMMDDYDEAVEYNKEAIRPGEGK